MPIDKKYYWLKLHKDFFKRHDIKIIEKQTNGKDYIIFYLKLLTESISHKGTLRFSDEVPYDVEMLSIITDTNVDIVRSAVTAFTKMGLMEKWEDGTYFMSQIEKMIGSESSSAPRVRRLRERRVLQCNTDVTLCNENVTTEKEIRVREIDLEEEKEKINKKESSSDWIPGDFTRLTTDSQITKVIDNWNGMDNLPGCKYSAINVPNLYEFTAKLSVYSADEITAAIINLSSLWEKVEPKFRPRSISRFIGKVDDWVDSAEPWLRYEDQADREKAEMDEYLKQKAREKQNNAD